jgi:hypothetical protein
MQFFSREDSSQQFPQGFQMITCFHDITVFSFDGAQAVRERSIHRAGPRPAGSGCVGKRLQRSGIGRRPEIANGGEPVSPNVGIRRMRTGEKPE